MIEQIEKAIEFLQDVAKGLNIPATYHGGLSCIIGKEILYTYREQINVAIELIKSAYVKPCTACGEFHPKSVLCPPHEVRMKAEPEPTEFAEKLRKINCRDCLRVFDTGDRVTDMFQIAANEIDSLTAENNTKNIINECLAERSKVLKEIVKQLQAENKDLTKRLQEVCPQFEDITGLLEEKK